MTRSIVFMSILAKVILLWFLYDKNIPIEKLAVRLKGCCGMCRSWNIVLGKDTVARLVVSVDHKPTRHKGSFKDTVTLGRNL